MRVVLSLRRSDCATILRRSYRRTTEQLGDAPPRALLYDFEIVTREATRGSTSRK
jgi:hypothetical protein